MKHKKFRDLTITQLVFLMEKYASSHNIKKGLTLTIEDDESGRVQIYTESSTLFDFSNIDELISHLT